MLGRSAFPRGRKIDAKGAGGIVDAELVSGVTLEIGGIRIENMTVGVMDLSMVSQQLGRPVTIVVGRELFNSAAIAFDWAQNRLTITPANRYEPPKGAAILPVERHGPFNFVKLSVAGLPVIDALLDLGNGGSVKLPSDYWSRQPALAGLRHADSQGGGVGGMHMTRSVTFPSIDFAGQRFERVPGTLGGDSHGNQPQLGANLGIGMLKQFDLTLDLGRDRIILKPLSSPPGLRPRPGRRARNPRWNGTRRAVRLAAGPRGPGRTESGRQDHCDQRRANRERFLRHAGRQMEPRFGRHAGDPDTGGRTHHPFRAGRLLLIPARSTRLSMTSGRS